MSLPAEPLYIAALGASTPVGRDALSSAAGVRAGISGFAEHPYMIDTAGEPMRVALAPWLDIDLQGNARFEALLMPAIEQALEPLVNRSGSNLRVALVLGLPSARPGLPADLQVALRHSIGTAFPNRFSALAVLEVGHAAGVLGLHAAVRKFASDAFDACVIAGVESYMAPETLGWLEENEQLHGAGPLNNAWGFIPGEAAGAVLVVRERPLAALGAEPLGRVLSVGRAIEQNRIKTKTVCIGEGLTAAFRETLAGLPSGAKVTDVYCDMNGEPYRADEFGFTAVRTKDSFLSASDFVAPADCWGDVSAASFPLAAILSMAAGPKAYANGAYPFVWTTSETGERGAALLEVPLIGRA